MWIIDDDDHELEWILERILQHTNLDEHELYELANGDSSHEHTGIGMAPALDMVSTSWLAPREGSSTEQHSRLHPCQGGFSVFLHQ